MSSGMTPNHTFFHMFGVARLQFFYLEYTLFREYDLVR